VLLIGPTFFAKLIFFPPIFFGILEKENLSEQKQIIGGKKINFAKKFF
jgi:hypothetical protein